MNNRIILNIKSENAFTITEEYIKECYSVKKNYSFFSKFRLVRYLKKSEFVFPTMDLGKCIFSGKRVELAESFYSDGEWLWSADLLHYTHKYNFIWPNEFIRSLKNKKYKLRYDESCDPHTVIHSPVFYKYTKEILGMEFQENGFEEFLP